MSNSPSTNSPVAPSGFGKQLADARKKRLMSTQDVADELNILRRHVEAIEAQDFANLPAKAFVRGFVINYAKLVGLDEEAIIKEFMAAYPATQEQQTTITPLKPMGTLHRGRAPIRLNKGLIAGVAALVILGLLILKMIGNATGDSEQGEPTQVQVVDSLSITEQAQGAAVGGAPNTGSALGAALASGPGVLDFWVKEATTISVRDASGTVLMSGNQNRGGHQLTGQPPFSIEIDNPSQVDLNFNQNPVSLADYTTGNKATLNLQ